MTDDMLGAMVVIFGYLVGGFCTGYYLVRYRTGGDIRQSGSGNVGAKNAGRVLGPFGFAITFAGDAIKGSVPVWLARSAAPGPLWPALALLAVVAGHLFPVQLGFKGGKGVATMLGALLVLDWQLAVVMLAIFLVLLALVRMFTVCGLVAVGLAPVVAFLMHRTAAEMPAVIVAAVLIIIAHRSNIAGIIRRRRMKEEHGAEPPGNAD